MMRTNGKIVLKGHFKNTGFGFSCFQKATSLNVTGKFEYHSEKEVEIVTYGEKNAIQIFYQWCINQDFPELGELFFLSAKPKHYNDFQIINQL